jgi:hypothetical protein
VARRPEVGRALRAMVETGDLVRVERLPKRAEPMDGVITMVGIRWVVVARLVPGAYFDGFSAVRVRDVVGVAPIGRHDWRMRRLEATGDRPEHVADLDPATTTTLFLSAARAYGLVSIHQRRTGAPAVVMGTVERLHDKQVTLQPIDATTAGPDGAALVIPFKAISRIDLASRRAVALAWALGNPTS